MKKVFKEVVKEVRLDIDIWDLEGSAVEISKIFQDEEDRILNSGFESVWFSVRNNYDSAELFAQASRPENESERNRRLKKTRDAKKTKKAKLEAEKELYFRLKKKFEK